jgi:hypothetical protein
MGRWMGQADGRKLWLADGVVPRTDPGGETVFFRRGDPEGRIIGEALAAGWARLVENAGRRRPGPRPTPLDAAQEAALARLFRAALRRDAPGPG